MTSGVENLEQLALDSSDEERARLAARLLDSPPSIHSDQDDGIAEALRRGAELDTHPERAISFEQLEHILAQPV